MEVAVSEVFQSAQQSSSSHRRGAARLRKLHMSTGDAAAFRSAFCSMVLRVLPVSGCKVACQKVIDFVVFTCSTFDGGHDDALGLALLQVHACARIGVSPVRLVTLAAVPAQCLAPLSSCKDKAVRLRCCTIISGILGVLSDEADFP